MAEADLFLNVRCFDRSMWRHTVSEQARWAEWPGSAAVPLTDAPSLSVPPRQVVLLSATMPSDVLEVTKKFMREPIRILVKKEELTLEGIRQFYINVEREVRGRVGVTVSRELSVSVSAFSAAFGLSLW